MIYVGLVTYNRPDYFKQSALAIRDVLLPVIDKFIIYNDGSKRGYQEAYEELQDPSISIIQAFQNKGVGYAKNRIIKAFLQNPKGEYLFISEDDVIVDKPEAVTAYIDLYKETGIEHFNFAHHGGLNDDPEKVKVPSTFDGNVEMVTNCVGAWSFYTRNCLEKVGLIDENFHNAWDHVEHTKRIAKEGLTTPFWRFADHKDSRTFLHEIPDCVPVIDKSSIKWEKDKNNGLKYWKDKDGEALPPYTEEYI